MHTHAYIYKHTHKEYQLGTETLPSDPFHIGLQTISTGICSLISTLHWLVDWLIIVGFNRLEGQGRQLKPEKRVHYKRESSLTVS